MSRSTLFVGICLGLAIGCGAATLAPTLVVPPARAGSTPTRWEYSCTNIPQLDAVSVTNAMNAFGSQGWEFVAREYAVGQNQICFKRPLP